MRAALEEAAVLAAMAEMVAPAALAAWAAHRDAAEMAEECLSCPLLAVLNWAMELSLMSLNLEGETGKMVISAIAGIPAMPAPLIFMAV